MMTHKACSAVSLGAGRGVLRGCGRRAAPWCLNLEPAPATLTPRSAAQTQTTQTQTQTQTLRLLARTHDHVSSIARWRQGGRDRREDISTSDRNSNEPVRGRGAPAPCTLACARQPACTKVRGGGSQGHLVAATGPLVGATLPDRRRPSSLASTLSLYQQHALDPKQQDLADLEAGMRLAICGICRVHRGWCSKRLAPSLSLSSKETGLPLSSSPLRGEFTNHDAASDA